MKREAPYTACCGCWLCVHNGCTSDRPCWYVRAANLSKAKAAEAKVETTSSTPKRKAGKFAENRTQRIELYRAGYTDAEIAEITGDSYKAIFSWRRYNRLPANSKYPLTKTESAELITRWKNELDVSMRDFANKIGEPVTTVSAWAKGVNSAPSYIVRMAKEFFGEE